jgi:hypothetical protein
VDQALLHRLAERVDRLERANRRWRRGAASVAVLVVIGLLIGGDEPKGSSSVSGPQPGAVPKELAAERFALRDKDGKDRIVMVVNNSGVPVLGFLAPDGREQLDLFFDPTNGPVITMRDNKNTIRVTHKVDNNGLPWTILADAQGKNRAILVVRDDGAPVLGLVDPLGKERIDLLIQPDGRSVLRLSDTNSKDRLVMASGIDGTPSVQLFDKDGKEQFQASAP